MSLDALVARLVRLEAVARAVQSNVDEERSEYYERVADDLLSKGVLGAVLFRVPPDYYSLSLPQRAKLLGSPVDRLCKTLILENVLVAAASTPVEPLVAGWSTDRSLLPRLRYLAVVVPYIHKLDMEALARFLRASGTATEPPPVKLVHAENGDSLAGFPFNGVTVFGGKLPMPIVVCKVLLEGPTPYIWLGGGEVDLKLRVPVRQLIRYAHVCECSSERTTDGDDGSS